MSKKQVTIGKKIGGGFGVVLFLTALLMGVYQFALTSATSTFTELIEVDMAIAVRANSALSQLNKCRRFEKDFLLTGNEGKAKEQKESYFNLTDELDTIEAMAKKANKPKMIQNIGEVRTQIEIYQENFELIVTAPEYERMSIEPKLRTAAKAAEPVLEELYKNIQDEANEGTVSAKARAKLLGLLALGLGGLALVSGTVLAFFLGRGISTTLKQVSLSLNEGAEQVAAAAGEVSSSSQTLAEGASQQAAAVEETSASLEEVGAMIKQDADNARQADELMKEANEVILSADESMKKLTTSMHEISAASSQTQKIVKTIDEIAFQTNLLALNAAVEAARAGEAGAGFAVVADEVRNLAMRAAEAAKNTSNLIEGTVQKINTGNALVSETSESFYVAAQSTTRIGTIITEMAGAASQQANAIIQVTKAIHEIDNVTQSNAAAAEESASASEELNAQAEMMKGSVGQLLNMVGGAEGQAKEQPDARRLKRPPTATLSRGGKIAPPARKALPPAAKKQTSPPAKGTTPEDIIPMGDDFEDF
ncbi:methyl-accepting chemotaxis protein [Thiovibrio frasassiensis]|uniref:Methyl-accepting chemotaxis protein n=1 Tax=Thiovibrio frasassiensis TaxID=2984131 RepID=A0A9X4MBV6_9BACT|nr:methyl-accepting chemotaxis protein [Thiovibrio frasassiensis]MDG4474616.1 methyl-accepting chemotaxis protein [Thiovibrio frasassiensis]